MRTMICGAIALGALALAGSAHAQYQAIAVSPNGAACSYGSTMDAARNNAVNRCRREHGGSCSTTTAEREHWSFVGGYCDGEPYSAASPDGSDAAFRYMLRKGGADGRFSCRVILSC